MTEVEVTYAGMRLMVEGTYEKGGYTRLPYGSTHVDRDDPAEFEVDFIRDLEGVDMTSQFEQEEIEAIEQLAIEEVESNFDGPEDREDR